MPVLFDVFVDLPANLQSSARVKRLYNRSVGQALKDTVDYWHRVMLKRHFALQYQAKYREKSRAESTMASKRRRFGNVIDRVMSGRTSRWMRRQIRITLWQNRVATGRMKWPPGMRERTGGVTMKTMAMEIRKTTPEDDRLLGKFFKKRFFFYFFAGLKPRQRRRLSRQLSALGAS